MVRTFPYHVVATYRFGGSPIDCKQTSGCKSGTAGRKARATSDACSIGTSSDRFEAEGEPLDPRKAHEHNDEKWKERHGATDEERKEKGCGGTARGSSPT